MPPNVALIPEHEHLFRWEHDCSEWDVDDDTGESFEHESRTSVRLPLGSGGWELVQAVPLTISPSILCHRCGTHGFWRDGAWVPA